MDDNEEGVRVNRELYEVDVLMIGAGIFGSVIGAELERIGRDVFYVDAERPMAGSHPAACLMRPSWLTGMGKDVYEPALRTLDRLYGLKSLTFKTRPLNKSVHIHWIAPSDIMRPKQVRKGWVRSISHENLGASRIQGRPLAQIKLDSGFWNVRANIIVVAAGLWTPKLFPHVELSGQAGAAFIWENSTIEDNFVSLWAPYKQVVGMNGWEPNTVWCGDGSAILPKNFNSERIGASGARCAKATGLEVKKAVIRVGVRPYSKMKPCHLEEVLTDVWIATGGAKNGTAAAGWAARQISEAVAD